MDHKSLCSSSSCEDSETDLSEINIWKTSRASACCPKPGTSIQVPKVPSCLPISDVDSAFVKKVQTRTQELDELHTARIQSKRKRIEKRRHRRRMKSATKVADRMVAQAQDVGQLCEEEWQRVKPFLGVFDHIAGPIGHGKFGPKTELEHKIDDSLEDGNFEKAEALSDQVANREFAIKVSRAFAARKASEQKLKEEKVKEAKKQKRLCWGFETKERWQMKGNM